MGVTGPDSLKRIIAALLALAFVFAVATLGFFLAKEGGSTWPWESWKAESTPGLTRITYVCKYLQCGDEVETEQEVSSDAAESILADLSSEWRVVSNEDCTIRVVKETDEYCPSHRDYRFIALCRLSPGASAHVCVFRGRKADPAFLLSERRDLTEHLLHPQDHESLLSGVEVTLGPGDPTLANLDEKVVTYLQGIALGR